MSFLLASDPQHHRALCSYLFQCGVSEVDFATGQTTRAFQHMQSRSLGFKETHHLTCRIIHEHRRYFYGTTPFFILYVLLSHREPELPKLEYCFKAIKRASITFDWIPQNLTILESHGYDVTGSLSHLYRAAFLYWVQLAQDKLTLSVFSIVIVQPCHEKGST